MKKLAILTVFVLLLTGQAVADDKFPPDWRGQDRTLRAVWDDWGDWGGSPPSAAPDEWETTPGGLAYDPYAFDDSNTGSSVFLASYENRSNVIEVNEDWDLGFDIPNYSDGPRKEVYFQVTYYGTPAIGIGYALPDGYEMTSGGVVGTYDHEDGWFTKSWWLLIEPNPLWEEIYLYEDGENYPMYIDQVVIDTICPEPGTMFLLCGAAVPVLLKRRRKV